MADFYLFLLAILFCSCCFFSLSFSFCTFSYFFSFFSVSCFFRFFISFSFFYFPTSSNFAHLFFSFFYFISFFLFSILFNFRFIFFCFVFLLYFFVWEKFNHGVSRFELTTITVILNKNIPLKIIKKNYPLSTKYYSLSTLKPAFFKTFIQKLNWIQPMKSILRLFNLDNATPNSSTNPSCKSRRRGKRQKEIHCFCLVCIYEWLLIIEHTCLLGWLVWFSNIFQTDITNKSPLWQVDYGEIRTRFP